MLSDPIVSYGKFVLSKLPPERPKIMWRIELKSKKAGSEWFLWATRTTKSEAKKVARAFIIHEARIVKA